MIPDRKIPQDVLDGAGATARRAPTPPRVSQILRALFSLLCGVLLFTVLSLAFTKAAEGVAEGGGRLLLVFLGLAAAMLLAGYGTARIAQRWERLVSAAVGLLMSLGAGPYYMQSDEVWRPLVQTLSLVLLPPFAILGGWMAGRAAQTRARRRAAEPLQVPLVIRQRTAVVWLVFFLGLGMTVASAWAVRLGDAPLSVWLGIPFFGAATLFLGWRGLRNTPMVILREDGIEYPALRTVIPWSEIIDAAPHPFHPIDYVRLRLLNPERYLSRMTPLQHALSQTGESQPNIGFALSGTPYTAEEICALVRSKARAG